MAVRAAGGVLRGTFAGRSRTLTQVAGHLVVTRNGRPARLAGVRPGDQVTVRTDAGGRMVRLAARGPALPSLAGPAPTALPRTAPSVLEGVVTASGPTSVTYLQSRPQVVRASPGLMVTRDGRPASLAALRPGDRVTVYRDARGRPTRLDALSGVPPGPTPAPRNDAVILVHGTVRSASANRLTFTASATGRDWTLDGPFGAVVTRNHRSGLSIGALRAGDGLTVVLDARGRVRAIDARGRPASAAGIPAIAGRPTGGAAQDGQWPLIALAALVALGLMALLLYGVMLVLRWLSGGRRRLPFVLVERRPGAHDDAAAPVNRDLTRGARVYCAGAEVGRLTHVVVLPETGALLRLILRDRSKAQHEVPAALVADADAKAVHLSADPTELQALLHDQPTFSARRYRAFSPDTQRAPDQDVIIDSTADTLHVALEGSELAHG